MKLAALLLALLIAPFAAFAVDTVEVHVLLGSGTGIVSVKTCEGAPLELVTSAKMPPCTLFTSPTGARIQVSYREGANVAGTSSALRATYCGYQPVATLYCPLRATRVGLGTKLGNLMVGTVARPSGYLCDPSDVVTSGSTVYSKIIDLAAPANLRGAYVTGCTL